MSAGTFPELGRRVLDDEPSATGARPFWASPLRSSLFDGREEITADDLEFRVQQRALEIGTGSLVLVSGTADVELVVTYLACLRAGSPVIVSSTAPSAVDRMLTAFDPDVVVRCSGTSGRRADVERRHRSRGSALHPDLAVLLPTSGSTGAPKLVRLSHRNVESNAVAIAEFMGLRSDDRAATSLPPHYCYGLSVLTSHLVVGADIVLTDLSVVDPCFWSLIRDTGVTTLPGVPHTFELLERIGFDAGCAPTIRRLTQAGGRMSPERVTQFAEMGQRAGFDLYVMYGQTEATARMAYLPPDLAMTHPQCVGHAVPGGELSIRPLPDDEVEAWPPGSGEVVYRGPNVMMGYAESPADLALPAGGCELVTGDVGTIDASGLLRLVGRRRRFTKIFGVRIGLDDLELELEALGEPAWCEGDDERLTLAARTGAAPIVSARVATLTGLPPSRIVTVEVGADLPRSENGKPDRSGLRTPGPPVVTGDRRSAAPSTVAEIFTSVLLVDTGPDDTFVGLGGDSLSYVEVSVMLEEVLGRLPDDWHLRSVAELERERPAVGSVRRRLARVETGTVLRAVAILLIVGNHMHLLRFAGGAHVLLAVAGFNAARFRTDEPDVEVRLRALGRRVATFVVPTVLWIGTWMAFTDRYTWANLLLVNNWFDLPEVVGAWRFWFIEALLVYTVVVGLAFCVPKVRSLERRAPFGFAISMLAVSLLGRFVEFPPDQRFLFRSERIAWVFVLGWAAQRATNTSQRLALSAVAVLASAGFSTVNGRNELMAVGLLLLIWVPSVPLPTIGRRVVASLGAASLGIYIVHSEIYPPTQQILRLALPAFVVVVLLSLAVGTALSRATAVIVSGRAARRCRFGRGGLRPAFGGSRIGRSTIGR